MDFGSCWGPVFVKQVVRRFHAASLISEALVSFSGFSQTGPAGCQLRVFPDRCLSNKLSAGFMVTGRLLPR